ncbi:Hypothetical predicted protein [Pelobates cultripes]|uniref:Tachylectin 2 domain-containing protein n=1 Tax=Pelobates cultripes TaxID=61616 RepID=A0AAD1SDL6_PELCU|nr:Hypothetical predicted protein [Pelobates cultripes]
MGVISTFCKEVVAYAPDVEDTILFAISSDYVARAGLPPKDRMDSYYDRSTAVGKLNDVNKIVFSPEGQLFAVRGRDLYTGPMPLSANLDWFSTAKRVGKAEWVQFKFLFFDPNGLLYAATKDGELYKGPAPSNENVSWRYGQATKIGNSGWNKHDALFFDQKGNLYAVTDGDKLVVGSPPSTTNDKWLDSCTTIGNGGWRILTHFMKISLDDLLWCVDSRNGNIYKGKIPTKDDTNYLDKAENLGWSYNLYRFLSLTTDKTIQSVVSFEFLPASGKILSQQPEVVQSQIYKNTSSVPLKYSFSFTKTMTETSSFTQEHGFTVEVGAEVSFTAGIPFIGDMETSISINTSTTHTWSFSKTNETQTSFSASTDVEVPGGKSIRMMASVTKAQMDVPYTAKICTLFGYETTIQGTWKGVTHYKLMVTQEDYSG